METFYQVGLTPEAVPTITGLCEERFQQLSPLAEPAPETLVLPPHSKAWLYLYPLPRRDWTVALLGVLKGTPSACDPCVIKKALSFFACALNKKIDLAKLTGLNYFFASWYNDNMWLYAIMVTALMGVIGLIIALVTDVILKMIGMEVHKMEHHE